MDYSTWSKIRKKQPLFFDRNIVLVHGGPELSVRRLLGRVYAAHLHLRRLSRLDGAHVARQHEPGVNVLKLYSLLNIGLCIKQAFLVLGRFINLPFSECPKIFLVKGAKKYDDWGPS